MAIDFWIWAPKSDWVIDWLLDGRTLSDGQWLITGAHLFFKWGKKKKNVLQLATWLSSSDTGNMSHFCTRFFFFFFFFHGQFPRTMNIIKTLTHELQSYQICYTVVVSFIIIYKYLYIFSTSWTKTLFLTIVCKVATEEINVQFLQCLRQKSSFHILLDPKVLQDESKIIWKVPRCLEREKTRVKV